MDDGLGDERETRSSVLLKAAYESAGAIVERRVRNLSAHGICIDADDDLREGMRIRMVIGRVATIGEVIWATNIAAGLHFDSPIDPAQARQPRNAGPVAPTAGWLGSLPDAYKRR